MATIRVRPSVVKASGLLVSCLFVRGSDEAVVLGKDPFSRMSEMTRVEPKAITAF